ncbi:hypothetical protein AQUCO_06000018v1 [Aquilegia coerulea]|uniref:Knottins-like domain-containing protein n=1 Tax=Aquilegia coerulea TaxID=218851 RepID=A0A2G5CDK2_AQUCA|nr:hypothetical protein AQUCO_06000018v1 [Aquilegia coerulea]
MRKSSVGCVLLFVLLLIFVHVEMEMVDARRPPIKYCESRSHGFRGLCFSKTNCGLACRHEGFHGGYCKPLSRHCYCRKPCV